MNDARENLIRILQNAYSGELAAAFAYRGHWKSVKNSIEKERIKRIEAEEWKHRANVKRWLDFFGAEPNAMREKIFWTIGKAIGLACFVSGWFFPMYFAGRLESGNVREYVEAAEYARELGMTECADEMMEMSRVEQEHEDFFREIVSKHRLLPITKKCFRWG